MSQTPAPKTPLDAALQKEILEAVSGLSYGSVEVTVHHGRVVSIETREKRRYDGGRKDADPKGA